MRTGFSADADAEDALANEAYRLLQPCLEAAVVVAAEYSKACGRPLLSRDLEVGLKFSARHVLGRQLESFFPELDDEDDADSVVSVDEDEHEWTRYGGDDERLRLVNRAADTWDDWQPETPLEQALKRSVDATV